MKVSRLVLAAALILALGGVGFAQSYEFVGAGATFPAPLYTKMFDEYSKTTGIKVNFQAIGSGGGQAQQEEPYGLWWYLMMATLAAALSESWLASRYLGTRREES